RWPLRGLGACGTCRLIGSGVAWWGRGGRRGRLLGRSWLGACLVDAAVEVAAGLAEINDGGPLLACACDVLDGVTEVEAEVPRFDDFDGFVGVVAAAVVVGVVDGVVHAAISCP